MLSDTERYSCQLKLPDFGAEAQHKLERAKVLIVGAGGLGCPAAQYLVAAGVGTVAIADDDEVSASNLHRQILFADNDVGSLKADVAARRLRRQNPAVSVSSLLIRITIDNVMSTIAPYDIVVDCTDNFAARYLLNDACVLAGKPLVYGAAYQYEGQVAVWNAPLSGDARRSSHYRDVFPHADAAQVPDCNTGGVLPVLTGIVGCMQAGEVIKYLAGLPGLLADRLFMLDAQTMQSRIIALPSGSRTPVTELRPPARDEVPVISVEDLRQSLTESRCRLIDVRTTQEHEDFSIGGENIPLARLLTGGLEPDPAEQIVLYCRSGARSAAAARYLLDAYPDAAVMSLAGGVEAWRALEAKPL